MVGIGEGHVSGGSGTQYFIGEFDSRVFKSLNTPDTHLWLDHGRDFYAAQTFAGLFEERIVLSWMSNWAYAKQTPTEPFRGCMSLPRKLALVPTPAGLRLRQAVVQSAAQNFEHLTVDLIDSAAHVVMRPESGTYRLTLVGSITAEQKVEIRLFV